MNLTTAQIAQVAHEANRAYQTVIGEAQPDRPWDEHPRQLDQIADAELTRSGATPEKQHETWLAARRAAGWTYGPVKDEAAKTHPCMVPYSELSEQEKVKDVLYGAVVSALSV